MCELGEFEEKLQSILGNPEALGQIMSIAQSLGGMQEEPVSQPEEKPSAGGGGLSDLLGGLDPKLLQFGMQLLTEYNHPDERKTALLTALRPYMREQRWERLDQAVHIARLAHTIRVAIDLLGGEGQHV